MKKITQYDRVLQHLQLNRKNGITSLQAFREYGITRLSAVIYDLRRDGYEIKSDFVARKNRYGEIVHFAKYTLEV